MGKWRVSLSLLSRENIRSEEHPARSRDTLTVVWRRAGPRFRFVTRLLGRPDCRRDSVGSRGDGFAGAQVTEDSGDD